MIFPGLLLQLCTNKASAIACMETCSRTVPMFILKAAADMPSRTTEGDPSYQSEDTINQVCGGGTAATLVVPRHLFPTILLITASPVPLPPPPPKPQRRPRKPQQPPPRPLLRPLLRPPRFRLPSPTVSSTKRDTPKVRRTFSRSKLSEVALSVLLQIRKARNDCETNEPGPFRQPTGNCPATILPRPNKPTK